MYETRLLITMDEHTRRRLRNTGLLLVLIGIGGIIVPSIMGLAISLLIAALLILAGILSGYVAWSSYNRAGSGWLKSIILVVLGLLIAFYPQAGTAAIGLMLILYFLMDGFANVVLSLELKPLPGWGWTMLNGVVSLVLGVVFIAGWPFNAHWLVGLLVGISLLLDGVALVMLARAAK
ncbi:MAG: hypothetical protein DSZ00_08175 [Gammaproteobacteria bacterium]|nr:MAG: hypothetical protein DSZ00_08175 [Gammaproteobacteria bacterium]RTZ75466.1 MAG: hypothetical protein DSZ02_03305 [Gammaproteobacteria bacterium]RTZ77085.1 MAG: hypothetical protein DSZ01_07315 [Gammaproteobacteria bacterium]